MSTFSNLSKAKTSRTTRSKCQGWAAFDLKQRQKQGLQPEACEDPYPPMRTNLTSFNSRGHFPRNNVTSARSFSSVILPSTNFPGLRENIDSNNSKPACDSGGNEVNEGNTHDLALNKLKELHGWADNCLIEDVMASVDNDIRKASNLLKGMVFAGDSEENKSATHDSTYNDIQCDREIDKSDLLGMTTDLTDDITGLSTALEDALRESTTESRDVDASFGQRPFDAAAAAANMQLILRHLRSIPVEPEWEEDDVYLSHRKDAIRMMRSASQNSRAATSSFLRGDHFSSHMHSLKAREEWLAAEQLNLKAAKEILNIRNSKNGIWKLDLHGLHATEAVLALQDHLQKIETQVPINWPMSPDSVKTKNGNRCASLIHSSTSTDVGNLAKQQATFKQRSTSLQVITGVGNHSRGQAALPTAVRTFLYENGYRFDETRPGVITVWPKFHYRLSN